jgi:NADPH:quinone reductase-like Zn-dependent oxidoreductase
MREGGRVAYPNGVEPEPKARPGVHLKNYNVIVDPKTIDKLNRLIEAGPFEAHVARTFRLDQAAAAHNALEEHYLGKLALRLS